MLPVAGIENATWSERGRARVAGARRALRASLGWSTVALAGAVGAAQAAGLVAAHGAVPTIGRAAVVVVLLAALAGLWVGTFAFVRLVAGRAGTPTAVVTTAAFYALALPLGTDDAARTLLGLWPGALLAAPALARLPWPDDGTAAGPGRVSTAGSTDRSAGSTRRSRRAGCRPA